MFLRPFRPDAFLRSVCGTRPFIDYCASRGIPFAQSSTPAARADDRRRWAAALAQLPKDLHAQVELDLALVNEMAADDAVSHLLEASDGHPRPPEDLPSGPPLALWFFLHAPVVFREVFLHHEIEAVDSWRTASGPAGIVVTDLPGKAVLLSARLADVFRLRDGRRFCTAEGYALKDACCFVAQVADRLRFLNAFADDGEPIRQRVRPARPVLFVYYPHDGTVLLQSPLRARDRVETLFQHFGQTVLGSWLTCDEDAFDLEPLKSPFRPLPDAADMLAVRLKALHLRYPERSGRRQLKLETLATDKTAAIEELLRTHAPTPVLSQLTVSHAELQVTLSVEGRAKHFPIRLWPNRSNLGQSPLGDRFRACLRRWGLLHG